MVRIHGHKFAIACISKARLAPEILMAVVTSNSYVNHVYF